MCMQLYINQNSLTAITILMFKGLTQQDFLSWLYCCPLWLCRESEVGFLLHTVHSGSFHLVSVSSFWSSESSTDFLYLSSGPGKKITWRITREVSCARSGEPSLHIPLVRTQSYGCVKSKCFIHFRGL